MRASRKILAPLGVLLVTWCTLVTSQAGTDRCPNCYKDLCQAPSQPSPEYNTHLLNTLYPGLFRNISTIRREHPYIPQECAPVCTADQICRWRCSSAAAQQFFNCMQRDGGSCCETCFSMTDNWFMVDVLHLGPKYIVHLDYQFQTWDEGSRCVTKNCDGECRMVKKTRQVLVSHNPPPHTDISSVFWGLVEYRSHCVCTYSSRCLVDSTSSAGRLQLSAFPLIFLGLLSLFS